MTHYNIEFTQEIVALLPVLINSNWKKMLEEEKFPFSYIYMKKLANGEVKTFSPKVNEALNELWVNLGLDMNSLNDIYTIADAMKRAERQTKIVKYKKGVK